MTGENEKGTALTPATPEDRALAEFRQRGAAEVAHRKEIKELDKIIAGMSFGSVSGSSFSPQTRWQIAKYCEITGAEPLTQVDILGGKPYLNANYWADNLINQPLFLRYEQRDLSPSVETFLRKKVEALMEFVEELEGPEKARTRLRIFEYIEEADEIALARAKWSPRATATVVIETTIYRFMNFTPIDKIRTGEITDWEKYVVPVSECNWAGGHGIVKIGSMDKKDPIGDANPGTTARSRSLRRCAAKAFSAWMGEYKGRIEEAEKAIEAEYEVIVAETEDANSALPKHGGPVAVSSSQGEPEAVNPKDAVDLPFEGNVVEPEPVPMAKKRKAKAKEEAAPKPPDEAPPTTFDRNDARKALFATLKDAGVEIKDRKAWQKEHGLPESTGDFTAEDYARAMGINLDPVIKKVNEGCETLGLSLEDLCLEVLGQDHAQYLKHWNALAERLDEELSGDDL